MDLVFIYLFNFILFFSIFKQNDNAFVLYCCFRTNVWEFSTKKVSFDLHGPLIISKQYCNIWDCVAPPCNAACRLTDHLITG